MKKTILSLAVMFTFALAANNVVTASNLSNINIELEEENKKEKKKKCDKKGDKACCSKDKKEGEASAEANAEAPKKCAGAEGKAKCCSKDKAAE